RRHHRPNGAGKSTLFECISGFYAPDEGEVELDGARLTGLSPDNVCRRRVALLEKANAHARTLSTGQRKRLELARALATQPRVVLIDEVTGGVDQRSIPGLIELVRELHAGGLTLLMIEHNMRVVTAVAQRILALHMGALIADGRPGAVARDRKVVEAYLGQAYTA